MWTLILMTLAVIGFVWWLTDEMNKASRDKKAKRAIEERMRENEKQKRDH